MQRKIFFKILFLIKLALENNWKFLFYIFDLSLYEKLSLPRLYYIFRLYNSRDKTKGVVLW